MPKSYLLAALLVAAALLLVVPAAVAELSRPSACTDCDYRAPVQTEDPSPTDPPPTPTHTPILETPVSTAVTPTRTEAATSTNPPPPPISTEEVASGVWNGYTDRRLNPQMDEYYSVWCHWDRIEVWRAVPVSVVVANIPLGAVAALDDGGSLVMPDGMRVSLDSGIVTIAGGSGNYNRPGEKRFALAECLARNERIPPTPASETRRPQPPRGTAEVRP